MSEKGKIGETLNNESEEKEIMKRKKQKRQPFREAFKMELRQNKSTFWVYTILRILVMIVMVRQFFIANYEGFFLCILTLVIFLMPVIIQFWDTILHTLNGFLAAAIGFSLVVLLNDSDRLEFELSPVFIAIVAFCFSMTIGVLWEFFEYGMDHFFNLDMQKDTILNSISTVMLDPAGGNHVVSINGIRDVAVNGESLGLGGYLDVGLIDTMKDLFVNFIGAIVFSVIGFFYVKNKGKGMVANSLIPTKKKAKNDFLQIQRDKAAEEQRVEEALKMDKK